MPIMRVPEKTGLAERLIEKLGFTQASRQDGRYPMKSLKTKNKLRLILEKKILHPFHLAVPKIC